MICADHITNDEQLPYVAWHEKSNESKVNGEKQDRCDECHRWFWPWERRKARTSHA
jgi:hypothetical protein